jgi:hypothetical protein
MKLTGEIIACVVALREWFAMNHGSGLVWRALRCHREGDRRYPWHRSPPHLETETPRPVVREGVKVRFDDSSMNAERLGAARRLTLRLTGIEGEALHVSVLSSATARSKWWRHASRPFSALTPTLPNGVPPLMCSRGFTSPGLYLTRPGSACRHATPPSRLAPVRRRPCLT